MKNKAKFYAGLLTLLPFLYFVFFFGFVFSGMFLMSKNEFHNLMGFNSFLVILTLYTINMFLIFGLVTFYIIKILKNQNFSREKKILWIILIFTGSVFSMPVYWYKYIWKD